VVPGSGAIQKNLGVFGGSLLGAMTGGFTTFAFDKQQRPQAHVSNVGDLFFERVPLFFEF
jgi:hypothetical protein